MATKTKPAPAAKDHRVRRKHEALVPGLTFRAATAEEKEAGLCGVIQGVALPYNVPDYYGTAFAPGCLDKTRAAKVGAKKVKLYSDHQYAVRAHVGVVLELRDVAEAAVMTAGLFDTEDGRRCKEYIEAVLSSGAETGLSVGFFERAGAWEDAKDGSGDRVWMFSEVELEEVSITPRPAVPGAVVTGVRAEGGEEEPDPAVTERAFRALAHALPPERVRGIVDEVLRQREATAAATDTPAATPPAEGAESQGDAHPKVDSPDSRLATEAERRAALGHALS